MGLFQGSLPRSVWPALPSASRGVPLARQSGSGWQEYVREISGLQLDPGGSGRQLPCLECAGGRSVCRVAGGRLWFGRHSCTDPHHWPHCRPRLYCVMLMWKEFFFSYLKNLLEQHIHRKVKNYKKNFEVKSKICLLFDEPKSRIL